MKPTRLLAPLLAVLPLCAFAQPAADAPDLPLAAQVVDALRSSPAVRAAGSVIDAEEARSHLVHRIEATPEPPARSCVVPEPSEKARSRLMSATPSRSESGASAPCAPACGCR